MAALAARGRFGVRLGLGRTRALLRELGDPQLGFRGALVAGTNGKGSVIALAGNALRAAGFRIGETPKPHLVSYRERLLIDGRPIDPAVFSRLVAEVLPAADRVARRHGDPTEFELLTAVIFRWFAESNVDLALVEVGLGGRLDATHAWDGGVAVITNVALDHTDRLGTTIPAIAREKAAIIERGDLAVTGATGEALAVVRRRAARLEVPLRVVGLPQVLASGRDGIDVDLEGMGHIHVGLRGRHQAANVAVADGLLDALRDAGLADVPEAARRRGYATATWPGRLELINVNGRDVLLDGAHNPAGAAALAVALDDLRPVMTGGDGPTPTPVTLLVAAMADKDTSGVATELARTATLRGARVICTSLGLPRALAAADLARIWRGALPDAQIERIDDVAAALDAALATEERHAVGPVVVAGSLYLVGEVRRRLVGDPDQINPEELPA